MRVLVACEFSGVVREAFRTKGHEAWSCDLLPAEDGSEFHIEGDALFAGNNPGIWTWEGEWDLIIAHPPCTALCVSGNRYYAGTEERITAVEFVQQLWDLPCSRLCIENPVGVINTLLPDLPKPQYIQPWMFGHDASKKTGLWKRGLPDLVPTGIVEGRLVGSKKRWSNQTDSGQNRLGPSEDRWKERSRTYIGIARAMADQWTTN